MVSELFDASAWDPVAGFDEEEGDSSDEEEAEAEMERDGDEEGTGGATGSGGNYGVEKKTGRWVKREVELRDGPRQLGFCVDGLEARIRVEVR